MALEERFLTQDLAMDYDRHAEYNNPGQDIWIG
jgi:hypothetical protein